MIPELTLTAGVAILIVSAITILLVGPRMVAVADRLADVSGLGEALVGAVLIGAATSLPDLIATVLPAVSGLPDLAVGNALGGVLAQTAFLAVADIAYRRANLEHAAASLPNLMQAALLITLLSSVIVLFHAPEVTVGGIHVGTFLLPCMYVYGLRLVSKTGTAPMWQPTDTEETLTDEADEPTQGGEALRGLVLSFVGYGALLATAGFGLGQSGEVLVAQTGLSETAVGVVFTGTASSLAELVVGISAVRRGALTMAVGNVIGGNTFDILLVGVADVAYREGSVYSAVGEAQSLYTGLALVMTGILLMGLLRRERYGVGRIGSESAAVLVLYVGGIAVIF